MSVRRDELSASCAAHGRHGSSAEPGNRHKLFGVQRVAPGSAPEPPLGVHRRDRRHRLAPAGTLDDGSLDAQRPGLAVHRVGTRTRFIPETHACTGLKALHRNVGVRFARPVTFSRAKPERVKTFFQARF